MLAPLVLPSSAVFPPVCTIFINGYARGMGHTCSTCTSRRRRAGAIIAAVIGLRMRGFASPSTEGNTEGISSSRGLLQSVRSRFRMTRSPQALKIVVVSWPIITQVSLPVMMVAHRSHSKYSFRTCNHRAIEHG